MRFAGKVQLVAGFWGLLCWPLATLACGLSQAEPESLPGGGEVYLNFVDGALKVGKFAELELQFCQNGQAMAVDDLRLIADMPAHGHGMNYQVRIITGDAGNYRIEGLLFHMPGEWRLRIDFSRQQNTHRFETRLTL